MSISIEDCAKLLTLAGAVCQNKHRITLKAASSEFLVVPFTGISVVNLNSAHPEPYFNYERWWRVNSRLRIDLDGKVRVEITAVDVPGAATSIRFAEIGSH